MDASLSSDSEDDEQKTKVKVKLESDEDHAGKKTLKKQSTTRSQKKVMARKHRKQAFKVCFTGHPLSMTFAKFVVCTELTLHFYLLLMLNL